MNFLPIMEQLNVLKSFQLIITKVFEVSIVVL